jgi:hypothetical protein
VEGYVAKTSYGRRERALTLSRQLTAAGCDPEKVTPAILMGEKISKRQHIANDPETRKARERKKVIERIRKGREARGVVEDGPWRAEVCTGRHTGGGGPCVLCDVVVENAAGLSHNLDVVATDGCKATTETTQSRRPLA